METVYTYRLTGLTQGMRLRLREAQLEAGRVWTHCVRLHSEARNNHAPWPTRDDLQVATKGQFALHSQTVQMICHEFLTIVENTQRARRQNAALRYPYRDKRFHSLYWPAQAVSLEQRRIVLPMGRGRRSLVFHVELPMPVGAVQLVWNDGYELHVSVPIVSSPLEPEPERATVDLGEIHQAAVTSTTGVALVVSGRAIRSLKRLRNKSHGKLQRECSRCQRGSRRWRMLRRGGRKQRARIGRQVRDLRHKGTRLVADFCAQHHVGSLYIGNPDGVRRRRAGRHHGQRMSQWEYGRDIEYLREKCAKRGISCFTGTERGTSSRCPECGNRQRPKGRSWTCRRCGFMGHRDVVGSVNMHPLAFGEPIAFPQRITYRRPGPARVRRRNEYPPPVVRARAS